MQTQIATGSRKFNLNRNHSFVTYILFLTFLPSHILTLNF